MPRVIEPGDKVTVGAVHRTVLAVAPAGVYIGRLHNHGLISVANARKPNGQRDFNYAELQFVRSDRLSYSRSNGWRVKKEVPA